jgi:hypothetical protein
MSEGELLEMDQVSAQELVVDRYNFRLDQDAPVVRAQLSGRHGVVPR